MYSVTLLSESAGPNLVSPTVYKCTTRNVSRSYISTDGAKSKLMISYLLESVL